MFYLNTWLKKSIKVMKDEVNTENLIKIKTLVSKPLLYHKRTLPAMLR